MWCIGVVDGPSDPPSKPIVLAVEDESLVRMSAMDMVEGAGFEAIAASDADEAIRILENRNDIRAVMPVGIPGPAVPAYMHSTSRSR
jgi:CheY-like chemotaxis protein